MSGMPRAFRLVCIAGALLLGALASLWLMSERRRPPNVLLVTIDTLRADRLGCYGHASAHTPEIDRLAKEGVLVRGARTHAPITLPAHASLMTGLLPPAHGVRDNGRFSLPAEATTLAERFRDAGYATAAFVSAAVLDRRYGLDQGFERYDEPAGDDAGPFGAEITDRPAEATTDRWLEWLRARRESGPRPFFSWVHYFDPHRPYAPRPIDARRTQNSYDAEIAGVDAGIGRLRKALEEDGLLDDTIIVVTADHGESLGEHGEDTHGIFVYDSTILIPLVVRYPKALSEGMVLDAPARLVDLPPTLLTLAGLGAWPEIDGIDLSATLRGGAGAPDLAQYAESKLGELGFGYAPVYAITRRDRKWIRVPRPELYDVKSDRSESKNLHGELPEVERELDQAIDEILADGRQSSLATREREPDEGEGARLRALGYVAGKAAPSQEPIDPKDGIWSANRMEEAIAEIGAADWQGAERILRDVIAKQPRNLRARSGLADVLARSGRAEEAVREYEASLAIDPEQDYAEESLGTYHLLRGELDEAAEHLRRARKLAPRNAGALVRLSQAERGLGNAETADALFAEAESIDPDHSLVWFERGERQFAKDEFAAALASYERAFANRRTDARLLVKAAAAAKRSDDLAKADRLLTAAIGLAARSWIAHYNLACVKSLRGKPDEAMKLLEQASKLGRVDRALLEKDRDLDALRARPDFVRLLKSQPAGRAARS